MPTLLEKIEADAAIRLPLPANRQPSQELTRYQRYLKVETHRLRILHRAGGSGLEISRARATVLDALLRHLLQTIQQNYLATSKTPPPTIALVAIGGYGRGELNPHSDIDIMFLHDGNLVVRDKAHPYFTQLNAGLLYTLYDVGLKVGHSVRSLADCVRVANTDMQSKTSLIEARWVAGNSALFQEMQRVVIAKCVEGFANEYIAARLEDQAARRAKYGNSACMQEPNIKNGCGGLRDYQNLLWMAFFKFRVHSLEELQSREQISAMERRQLAKAYDFLLRVRNDLHYHVNRPMDVLTKNVQPSIATNLGYTDRSPMKRIEQFMRDVYVHLRNIYLITRALEQRLALHPPAKFLPAFRGLFGQSQRPVDGFKYQDGEIQAASNNVFRDHPRRLMRVFLLAQQRRARLHPNLAQEIRQELSRVDHAFKSDPHVRDTFLEILSQRGYVAPILRSMHEVGLLGRYLPEFGKLTCLVQHEFFHRYTADEHTLVCLEKLDQTWAAQAPPFQRFAELFRKVERPFTLYLALLLHDAGKANTANRKHTDLSVQLAERVAKRLVLDDQATQTLNLLIEHHLSMTQISQRRDLDDPTVARHLANAIKTPENLGMLLLLTFADTQGTSADLWNDFKESLLWTLYQCTLKAMLGGAEYVQAEAKQRESLALEVRRQLPRSLSEEELQAHFSCLPPRYFQIHSASDVVNHLTMVHRFLQLQFSEENRELEPVITWQNKPDRGYTAVTICTWDRGGLFSKIAGSLTAAGLNILNAQVFSRTDRIIIDTLFVTEAWQGKLPQREGREKFEHLLKTALISQLDVDALIARQRKGRPAIVYLEGERLPTRIHFDNQSSDTRTIIDVETEDCIGLLYALAHALSELRLDISLAKICTEKGAAIDSFYISELTGSKVTAPERLATIERKLRTAITNLDAR